MNFKNSRFRFKIYVLVAASMILLSGCSDENMTVDEDDAFQEDIVSVGDVKVSGGDSRVSAEEYFNQLLSQDSNIYDKNPVKETEEKPMPPVVPDKEPLKESNQSGVIEIDSLDADNSYMQAVPMGATCIIDLNNDGKKDTIRYQAILSEIAEYGTTVDSFEINGGQYRYTLYLSEQGIHIQKPDLVEYYITDIDTRDNYKEIALLDHGANGIPYTYFIRFVGNGTYCLGYVPYFPSDDNFLIKGDGSIESAYDLKLLKNVQASATWLCGWDQRIKSNLKMYKPDLFYFIEEQSVQKLLRDLKVYTNRDLNSATIDLKASDMEVSFVKTDDEHWVYIKQEEGLEGWMYMENSDIIVSGDKKYNRRDVFTDL